MKDKIELYKSKNINDYYCNINKFKELFAPTDSDCYNNILFTVQL